MPKLLWRVTATDGTFQAGQTNLFDFKTDDLTLKERQVNEILLPNATQLSRYAVVSSNTHKSDDNYLYYMSNSGTWTSTSDGVTIADTKDYWLVIVPDSTNHITRLYVCATADQKSLIPNYANIPTIEYKIVSSITKDNFANWRTWRSVTPGYVTNGIILAPYRIYSAGNLKALYLYLVKPNDSTIRIQISGFPDSIDIESDVDQGTLPVVSQILNTGNQIVYDLEERVTILETKVNEIDSSIKALNKIVKDIETRIVDIGSASSLYFVSR